MYYILARKSGCPPRRYGPYNTRIAAGIVLLLLEAAYAGTPWTLEIESP